jgi:GntR family transcriptional regulator
MKTSIPLYHHLKSSLLSEIQAGKWEPGEAIPSEPELARKFSVSRTTVRQAVGDLVSSGYLTRRQGRGTFVADRQKTTAQSPLYGFAEELRQRGQDVQILVHSIEIAPCPDEIMHHLGANSSQSSIHIVRTAQVDDNCVFYESSWLVIPPHLRADELDMQPSVFESVYGFFEKHGVKIGLGKQTIRAGKAEEKDVEFLNAALGDPLLIVTRLTQDVTGSPLEFSKVVYASSLYEFEINLHREER